MSLRLKISEFFYERDPDFGAFSQAFAMFLANIIGMLLWLMRFPFSSLIITAPGIIAAIIFNEYKYKDMFRHSLLSGVMIAVFMIVVIMLKSFPGFTIVFTFLFVYLFFASGKTRFIASFSIVPCVLAFNMPTGALSAVDRAVEAVLSSFIAFLTVIFIRELFFKRKLKRVIGSFILEMEELIKEASSKGKSSSHPKLDKLSMLCIKVVNKERCFFLWNTRKAERVRPLIYQLIEIYRTMSCLRKTQSSRKESETMKIKSYLAVIREALVSEEIFKGKFSKEVFEI